MLKFLHILLVMEISHFYLEKSKNLFSMAKNLFSMATLVMYNILLRFHVRNKNIQLKIKNQILKRLSSKVSKNILYKNLITYILNFYYEKDASENPNYVIYF